MWRRLRRRTLAPSRPLIYPDQIGLLILTILAIGSGVYVTLRLIFG